MSAIAANEPTRPGFPNEIGPFKSNILCHAAAIAFGVVCGIGATMLWELSSLREGWGWAAGVMVGGFAWDYFIKSCSRILIETGHVAVPTFLGKRLRMFPAGSDPDTNPKKSTGRSGEVESKPTNMYLLSEGSPLLLPGVGAQTVNAKLNTSEKYEVEAQASTGMLMRAFVQFEREVVNPYLKLSAEDADKSVFEISATVVRNLIPCHCPADLMKEGVRKDIGRRIKEDVDEHDYEYGLNVTKIFIAEILPPQSVLDAFANIEIEVAQAKAEATEMAAVRERIKEMVEQDKLDIKLAYEFFQAERGKAQTVRNTLRIEGLDHVLSVLEEIIKAIGNHRG